MVVDPYTGSIYVASNYNDGVHGGQMAVTRFDALGRVDLTFGTQGTLVIPKFGGNGYRHGGGHRPEWQFPGRCREVVGFRMGSLHDCAS